MTIHQMFKKIASNTIAQILSKALTAIISIFLISLLTGYLSLETYWVYNKIYNYLWIFAFLADLWLYTIMIRELSWSKEAPEKIVGNVLTLRALLWWSIIGLALLIGVFLPWYNSDMALIWIGIVWVFTLISLLNSSLLALMQSKLKIEFSLVSVVSGKLVTLGMIIAFFLFVWKSEVQNMGTDALVFVFIAGLVWIFLNTFLNYFYARKICSISFCFDWEYIKYIFKISLPYWIALFLSVVYFKIDIIILSLIEWENSDISIALYSLPMKIVEVLMVLWWFYLNSVLPKLTALFENYRESSEEIKNILTISFKILFSFWVFIATFGIVFRENIIQIIANSWYLENTNHIYNSSDALLIVLLILVVYFISLLYIYIFISAKKQSILLKINIAITLFNIVGNIVLIPHFSFMGAAYITLLSQVVLIFLAHHFSKRIINFSIPKIFTLKILLLAWISYATLFWLIQNHSLWIFWDMFVYWTVLAGIYVWITYRMIRK